MLAANCDDLDDLVFRAKRYPKIFLQSGQYQADLFAIESLRSSLTQLRLGFTLNYLPMCGHGIEIDKEYLKYLLKAFAK